MSPAKKQRIMRAAESLFRRRQFHEITLDEVAREADVGKGTLYLYFADKDDLFFQTAVAGFDEMCAVLRSGAAAGEKFPAGLRRACETIGGFFRDRRALFRMILAEDERMAGRRKSLRQRWLERRPNMTRALSEVVARAQAAGSLRSDLPAEILAEYLLGMLRTRAWELEDKPAEFRTNATVVDLFIRGAAVRPVPPSRPAKNL